MAKEKLQPKDSELKDSQTIAALNSGATIQKEVKVIVKIDNDEAELEVIDMVKTIKTRANLIEDRRAALKKPHLDGGKAIDNWLKPQVDALNDEAKRLTKVVTEYRTEKQKKADEEQERLNEIARKRQEKVNELAEKKGIEAPVIAAPQIVVPRSSYGGISTSKIWDFEITDIDKIPRTVTINNEVIELMVPNDVAIRKLAKAYKAGLDIDGIKAVTKDSNTIRL